MALLFACTMEVDDPAPTSEQSGSSGALDDWQGIWDFDWQVTGGGCSSLYDYDSRFVEIRWVGAGQLMLIYDDDWNDVFDDSAYLLGFPGGDSVAPEGHYTSGEQEYHVSGTFTQMNVDHITGTLNRDIVGSCTEVQTIDAFRISYQSSVFEDSPRRARVLFHDDLDGSLESVSIRAELLPDRAMFVDTSAGKRVLVDVPAGQLRVTAPGHMDFPLHLREGEVRDVYLSSLISNR